MNIRAFVIGMTLAGTVSGGLKAQGEPLRIVVSGDTGVFWTRGKEDILIAKGIQRLQLQHENGLLELKILALEGMHRNCEERVVTSEEIIANKEAESVMLQARVEELESDLKFSYAVIDKKKRSSRTVKILAGAIGFALGVFVAR